VPTLILIAGPNGAGKTTFAREILTSDLKGMRFINADEIARGLSPFNPDSVALKAGRILSFIFPSLTNGSFGMRRDFRLRPWQVRSAMLSPT
jgi:predicted ABC-type ATPase